jgi:hypothetical protein
MPDMFENWKPWTDYKPLPGWTGDRPDPPSDRARVPCSVCGRPMRVGGSVCSLECAEAASEIASGA